MTRQPRALASCLLLPLLLAASGALAEGPRFELSPFVGYRIGGEFDTQATETTSSRTVDLESGASWGVDLGLYRDDTSFYELLYSRQSTGFDSRDAALGRIDVVTEYYQVGGTLLMEPQRWVVPWLSLTIGATRLSADGGYGSETKFSGSLGGGLRLPVNEHFGIVLGLRGYLTLVDSDTEFLCISEGGEATCLVRSSGSTYFQGEATAGFTLRF